MPAQTNIIDDALAVIDAMTKASVEKQNKTGSWTSLLHPPEEAQKLAHGYIKQINDVSGRLEVVNDLLDESHTQEQMELHNTAVAAALEIADESVTKDAMEMYNKSLSAQQLAWIEEVENLQKRLIDLQETLYHLEKNVVLSIPIPKDWSQSRIIAAVTILNSALRLIGVHSPDEADGTEILISTEYTPENFKLMIGKKIPSFPELRDYIDTQMREKLADPANWQRVKTMRGIGYMVCGPRNHETEITIFDAARTYSWRSGRLKDVETLNEHDGIFLNINESPNEDPARQAILLSGALADEILSYCGVDKHRIKDAPRQLGS